MQRRSIFIGWDYREAAAFAVARSSCRRRLNLPVPIRGLRLNDLISSGLYKRPFEYRPATSGAVNRKIMWDTISDAPQSTEHANSRFLVPYLAQSGWALFCDGDVMFRSNVTRMFDSLDSKYAAYCVKHKFAPPLGIKMDGQLQMQYARKNWSSFVAFNVEHPANSCLRNSTDMANMLPGRDLHRFCWLEDEQIGELDPGWNFLVGHTTGVDDPKVVHFTSGTPDMPGYENAPFADEWRSELEKWAD